MFPPISTDIVLKPKEVCTYYLKKLLEEIVLQPNPTKVHCGKCAVLGQTFFDKTEQHFYLTNLELFAHYNQRISHDGEHKILLLMSGCSKPMITTPKDKFIEVYGEIGFFLNTEKIIDNAETIEKRLSANNFISELGHIQVEMEAALGLPRRYPTGFIDPDLHDSIRKVLTKKINQFILLFQPAFIVHNWYFSPNARRLIRINMICDIVCTRPLNFLTED